jgi:hypothetical protein
VIGSKLLLQVCYIVCLSLNIELQELQVDEIVNLSSPLRERYKETPAGCRRCLKLSITDGVQRIFGIEYRPIKDLMVLSPAGLKVSNQHTMLFP